MSARLAGPTSDDYIYQTGAVYDAEPLAEHSKNPPGEWNHYRIAFVGDRITVDLNDMRIIDWVAETRGKVADFTPRGYIGLQNHDDRSAVYCRNIRVKEVREQP